MEEELKQITEAIKNIQKAFWSDGFVPNSEIKQTIVESTTNIVCELIASKKKSAEERGTEQLLNLIAGGGLS